MEEWDRRFAERGEAGVGEDLAAGRMGERKARQAQAWLERQEARRRSERDARTENRADIGLDLQQRSLRIAVAALVVSAGSLLVAGAALLRSCAG